MRCSFSEMAASDNNYKEKKDISPHHHSTKPRKILIVDDEPDITSTFDLILEMNGFEVDTYNDPSLALSNFKPNSYVWHY
jgi:PleD family two-component response regulator